MSKQKPPIWMKTAEKGPAGAPIKADVSSWHRNASIWVLLPSHYLATWIARRTREPFPPYTHSDEENPGETDVEIMKQTTTRRRKSALGWQRREFRLFTTFRVHIYYGPPPVAHPSTLFLASRDTIRTLVRAQTCALRVHAYAYMPCLCVSPSRGKPAWAFVRLSNIITLWNENFAL